ncbi:UNVERIFIED_CONTAM: hypothetical protein GTU68_005128 [Idotea baltica]|nr:hypothetical protein [Idotea baltica]
MSILRAIQRYPILIQSFQAGTLMGSGDVISQIFIERKQVQNFDWIRPIRFFGIGFVVVAPTLRVWYSFLDKKFGSKSKLGVLKKVAVDQLVFAPCFLGLFLTVVGVTQKKTVQEIQTQIKNDYKDIILTNWTVWPAVQVCNFSFVPLQHQVLVVQIFALLWNTYMAWKTNRTS